MLSGDELIDQINHWDGAPNRIAIWWLGQASIIIKMSGKTIYIDPYLSPHKERQTQPVLTPEQVTNADIVLCTHEHEDHLDPGAIPGIAAASSQSIFVVPQPLKQKVINMGVVPEHIVGLNMDQSCNIGEVLITAIKAKHEAFDRTTNGFYPYLGYVVQSDNICFYNSGDCINYEGLLTRLQEFEINVVFIPINGRDAIRYAAGCLGNFTYQEAVDLIGELHPQLVIPVHYDMFASNSEDPQKFIDYLKVKYPDICYWVGSPGEIVEVKC